MNVKTYGLDYVAGNNARKLYYEEEIKEPKIKKAKPVKKVSSSQQMSLGKKILFIASVLGIFAIFMIIIYRSNMISEANLKAIKLKSELEDLTSDLSLAMMTVEQGQNLNYIEAYAKQKLGMQKPDKNQIIYVDTSAVKEAQVLEETNKANGILDSIKKFFNIK